MRNVKVMTNFKASILKHNAGISLFFHWEGNLKQSIPD